MSKLRASLLRMMTLTAAVKPRFVHAPVQLPRPPIHCILAFWHGSHIQHSAMIPLKNHTCQSGGHDWLDNTHPRDVRLQIYISMTLGVGAFLLFCVRLLRCSHTTLR